MKKEDKVVYDNFLKIESREVDLGYTKKEMERVVHPGSVSVFITDTSSNNVIFVKQYRYPIEDYTLENVAGHIEEGETPEEAAIREVKEETGYIIEKDDLSLVGGFYRAPGYSTEKTYLFTCNVSERERVAISEEGVEVVEMPVEKFLENPISPVESISMAIYRYLFLLSMSSMMDFMMEALLEDLVSEVEGPEEFSNLIMPQQKFEA